MIKTERIIIELIINDERDDVIKIKMAMLYTHTHVV